MNNAAQIQDLEIKIGQFIIAEADVERTTDKAILFKFTYRADRENAFYATCKMWAPKSATITEGDQLVGFSNWFERKIEQELYTRN